MARTKQTARRSAGGIAPRKQLSTTSASNSEDISLQEQIDIFKHNGTRTIVVEGTAELVEKPDLVHLSFLVEEEADTLQGGIFRVGQVIRQVRQIADEHGLENENVYSDSVSSEKKNEQIGYYCREENARTEQFKVIETKEVHVVKSVVRICLQNEQVEKFNDICFDLMTKVGLQTHQAPVYELEKITEVRNDARQDAMENAKQKAQSLLEALKDKTVSLGPPIAVKDIHCNLRDDAEDSFMGNYSGSTRVVVDKDAYGQEPVTKKARTEDFKIEDTTTKYLSEGIFVLPVIHVGASVRCIFEIQYTKDTT